MPFTEKWDQHFLAMSLLHSKLSKDPNTRVGSVIVGPDREIVSAGFNGFPRGIADTTDRLNNKDVKLGLMVHAEMNAVLYAARIGTRLKGTTLYLACTDASGMVWGGPPCTRCLVHIIPAGIEEIVAYPAKVNSSWAADLAESRRLIDEAQITYRERIKKP